MDKDTRNALSDADYLREMTGTEGWRIAKKRFFDKINELSDILSFDNLDPQKLMLQIASHQQAIKQMIDWLGSIEGDVAQEKNYNEILQKEKENSYIKHY